MTKVLIAEDDQNLCDLYKNAFSKAGYDVAIANDGQTALEKTVNEKPDLVILDLNLPNIDGFNLLEVVKSDPECADIKFLVVSARGDEKSISEAKSLGVDDYLVKSKVDLDTIVAAAKKLSLS